MAPRFKIWRKSNAAEVPPSPSLTVTFPPPQPSATPLDPPKAVPAASSAPTIITDQLAGNVSSRQSSLVSYSSPQTDPSSPTTSLYWAKVPAGHSSGPWGEGFKAYKPPPSLTILDTSAHNPRSPIAWFIDQLGIPLLRIIPRKGNCLFGAHCEYELGNLNISKSVEVPAGYREGFTTHDDFADGSWRRVSIFSTPVNRNPLRMTRACEAINSGSERITIAFKVVFLDTNETDRYTRVSYEESWTYFAFNKPTMEDFYQQYGQVLKRTTGEHQAAREFGMGPWTAEGRVKDTKVPKMYEESKKFLKVEGDAERIRSREMQGLGVLDSSK